MKRVVALKFIHKHLLTNPLAVQRFYREIEAVARLSHPNIVMAFDADEIDGTHFFVTEYVDGVDLRTLLERDGPLPVAQACEAARQAALGLQHAHLRGLVHRDIKPANLLLSREGVVKIVDLGLARLALPDPDDPGAVKLTRTGELMGTPDYLAPEQIHDFHRADIRADIYSLGCTLYQLLTGEPPFAGRSLAEKLLVQRRGDPPDVTTRRSDLPPGLAAVVHTMMASRPEHRFQTPAEVAAALEPFGRTIVAAPARRPPGAAPRNRAGHGRDRVPPVPPERYETWVPGPGFSSRPRGRPRGPNRLAPPRRPVPLAPEASSDGQPRPRQAAEPPRRGDPRRRAGRAVDLGLRAIAGGRAGDLRRQVRDPGNPGTPGPVGESHVGTAHVAPPRVHPNRIATKGSGGPVRSGIGPSLPGSWSGSSPPARLCRRPRGRQRSDSARPSARRGLHPAGQGLQRFERDRSGPSPTPPSAAARSGFVPGLHPTGPGPQQCRQARPGPRRQQRGAAARPEVGPGLHATGLGLPPQGRPGPGHRRLQRGAAARSENGLGLRAPGPGLHHEGRTGTRHRRLHRGGAVGSEPGLRLLRTG